MSDDIQTADADDSGSTPEVPESVPGSTPGAISDESESSPEGSEAAGSTPEGQPAEGSAEPPVGWQNFLKKFTGKGGKVNYAEAEKSYWSATKGAAEKARENEALKAKLAELESAPKEPPKPKEPEAPPPQLAKLEERIKSFAAEKQQLEADRQSYVTDARKIERDITILEHDLTRADEMDKPSIEAQLRAAKGDLARTVAEWKKAGRDMARLDAFIEDANDRRSIVERELEAERERQEQAEAETARFNEEFPRQIDGFIEAAATELNIGIPAGEGSFLWEVVNSLLIRDSFLNRDKPAGALDYPELAKSYVGKVAEALGVAKTAAFQETSKETLAVKKPIALTPKAPAQKAATDPPKRAWERPENQDWRDKPQYRAAREAVERAMTRSR